MANTILKAVLTKLVDCMNAYNRYSRNGLSNAADSICMKVGILSECLKNAGYKMHIVSEKVEIIEGTYRGMLVDCYSIVSFDVPDAPAEDINAFQEAGFEWLWASNIMKYEFVMNRKEETV